MIDREWITAAVEAAAQTDRGNPDDVGRLRDRLREWACGFAEVRADVASPDIAWPRRGLDPDEATSFLTAVYHGQAAVDAAGFFTMPAVRRKTPPGQYALLSKSGRGVSINLEYLIQAGATAELVREHGWPGDALEFERGEFDAVGHAPDNRIILAVEAKCRTTGPDSLEKLLRAWIAVDHADPPMRDNAGRKYTELVRLCQAGPMAVWLVAARARWTFLATLVDGTLVLEPTLDPGFTRCLALCASSGRRMLSVSAFHAAAHAPMTAGFGGRCSWMCKDAPSYTVRVRELGGSESTFALCEAHLTRVQALYSS